MEGSKHTRSILSKLRILSLIMLFSILLFTGCAALGMASPFSDGKKAFEQAQSAWEQGEYALSLSKVVNAIAKDAKFYPAYKFLVQNYAVGIGQIDNNISELRKEPTIDNLTNLIEIYENLEYFYYHISKIGVPDGSGNVLVTWKKESISIAVKDKDGNELTQTMQSHIVEVMIKGAELALIEGKKLFTSRDFENAKKMFELALFTFMEKDTQEYNANKTIVVDLYTTEIEKQMVSMTFDDLERIDTLIADGQRFEKTEKLDNLKASLATKALDLLFAESDRIAQQGTIDAYKEAIKVSYLAYDYTSDKETVKMKRYTYANKLVDLLIQELEKKKQSFNHTQESMEEVYDSYLSVFELVKGWPDLEGDFVALRDDWADFNENSRVRVYAVSDYFTRVTMDTYLENLKKNTQTGDGKYLWFHTADELELIKKWENKKSRFETDSIALEVLKESDNTFEKGLKALTSSSSFNEAKDLKIDYLIKIDVRLGDMSNIKKTKRTETLELSLLRYTKNGEHSFRKASDTIVREIKLAELARSTSPQALPDYLEKKGITNYWLDEPTKVYYQTTTAEQRVYYSVTLHDVNSGKELYNQDFQMMESVSSKEEIVDVDWPNSIVKQVYEKTYPVISESGQKIPSVSDYEINKVLVEKIDYSAMAQYLTRH